MRDVLILAIHLLVTLAKFLRSGGVRQVAAESILLKHQLLISNRSRRRAPNLSMLDRLVLGLATLFLSPTSHSEIICEYQTGNPIQVPQGHGPSKISPAVLLSMPDTKAWPEGPIRAAHRGHRRDEAPQSEVRLCPHRPADRLRLWHRDQQRCRAARARHTLSTQA